ncbi:Rop family plasmid primer RNA-binding protein, partial [Klebsiella aerogenes]
MTKQEKTALNMAKFI